MNAKSDLDVKHVAISKTTTLGRPNGEMIPFFTNSMTTFDVKVLVGQRLTNRSRVKREPKEICIPTCF